MKIIYKLKKIIKSFFSFLICSFVLISQSNNHIIYAFTMENQNEFVTEELRLEIPSIYKRTWLEAESKIWEPWLSKQDGYLGRQIFWDKTKEQALILVNWKNKELWKSISMQEVNEIQKQFEEDVKSSLNINVNPFKLIYEGELYKEG